MKVKLIAIAAIGKNREIGLKGRLPWNLPDEYAYFKRTIQDQHVLIGRKNFELHGKNISGSKVIVLTKNPTYSNSLAKVIHDLNELEIYSNKNHIKHIYVMGGAEIYQLTLPYLSEFLCSEIDYSGQADSYFPKFDHYDWTEVFREEHPGWVLRKLRKKVK